MTRRKLRSDELDLWQTVAESTTPLESHLASRKETVPPKNPIVTSETAPRRSISPFVVGAQTKEAKTRIVRTPSVTDHLHQSPVNMDHKTFKKLKRGKIRPEGRIDLHGLRIHEARPDLTSFILRAHAAGKRLVLVITGKGRHMDDGGPIPTRTGILRHEVPSWLRASPLATCVQQVLPASDRDGGSGAYYVYLRRSSRGK